VGKLRVLVCHNRYRQRGGEDSVCESEVALLEQQGHDVALLSRNNDDVGNGGALRAAVDSVWSFDASRSMVESIRSFRPDVIHVHNTFAKLSPAIYWAAAGERVPVVQTLHNFRLLCPQAMFLRDGRVCEDCIGKLPWRGVAHACFRGSRAQTAVLGGMVTFHRAIGTWKNKVTRYIALNQFCRNKFIEGGLPAERIVIKPNFVDFAAPEGGARAGFLFVGRLSVEKGVAVLADATRHVPGAIVRVAGTGPEEAQLDGVAGVERLGALNGDAVRAAMCSAEALVLPSIWYENFPRTLVEAFAAGLPVIASRLGALEELVTHGETGLLFKAGDAADLAEQMRFALANPDLMKAMGSRARARYESEFTAQRNYRQLIDIYDDAIATSKRRDV
jgi:glycosyltransferase involved in cell wall biosynthesis